VKMPVGLSDFSMLIRGGYYFVDKTDFIRKIIDNHANVTLLARPRRFGKTLTLSMVDYFFNISHRLESANLFKGTKISASGSRYMDLRGTKPVLFLTLKDIRVDTYDSMVFQLSNLMGDVYDSFHFLPESPSLTERQKNYYGKIVKGPATEDELMPALRNLIDMLAAHYGKPVLLLLDEYDAPMQKAWDAGYYEKAISFMRNFLSPALKDNPSLDFALITGVLRIAKESIFSGLNNLSVSTVLGGGYAGDFGFTGDEVRKIAEDFHQVGKMDELASWYDGYNFQGLDIYNPWSVINYFHHHGEAASYWVNTSDNRILAWLLANADERRWQEVRQLMEGKSIISGIDENVVYGRLAPDRNMLYTVLLFTGYLKPLRSVDLRRGLYELSLPNREIRDVFEDEILSPLGEGNKDIALYEMQKAMMRGNKESFQFNLGDILRRSVSIHDAAKPESFYHGLMLGFALYYENDYTIRSNRESGFGRYDLAMLPKKENLPGIIMEFKAVKDEKDMEKAAEKAKEQIEEKSYATELKDAGVRAIWTYGIAFCGKKVLVK